MRWLAPLALIAPALAACSALAPNPSQSLADVPSLLPVVQSYYDKRATEEKGRCLAPVLDGVLSDRVVRRDGQRLVVELRYLYRDRTADLRGACIRFGNRTFTIETGPEGPMVIEVTGEQHPESLRLRLAS